MNRLAAMAFAVILLSGCQQNGLDLTETKEGIFATSSDGVVYKISSYKNEMIEVSKVKAGQVRSKSLNKDQMIPRPKGEIKVSLKAKITREKTFYQIDINIPKDKLKDSSTDLEKVFTKRFVDGLLGVKSLNISFLDSDGFNLGQESISLTEGSWSGLLGLDNKISQLAFNGSRPSSEERLNLATSISIGWISD